MADQQDAGLPEDDRQSGESPQDNDPEAALAKAEAAAAENWERFLRARAELENLRRRGARDVEQARRTGADRLAADLLAVVDSLEMGVDAASAGQVSVDSLREGQATTLRQLKAALERAGIETVDPLGEPFDPQFHEAMSMQPSDTAEPGSVLLVMQKGYRVGERLLRPARVIVAGDPPGAA